MEAVVDITTIPRDLPFDVQPQSTCKPIKTWLNTSLKRQNQDGIGPCDICYNLSSALIPPSEFQLLAKLMRNWKFLIFSSSRPAGRAVHLTQLVQVQHWLPVVNMETKQDIRGRKGHLETWRTHRDESAADLGFTQLLYLMFWFTTLIAMLSATAAAQHSQKKYCTMLLLNKHFLLLKLHIKSMFYTVCEC